MSRLSSRYTRYVPEPVCVSFRKPDGVPVSFKMTAFNGNCQVAWALWRRGLDGYETPLPRLYSVLAAESACIISVGANSGFYEVLAGVVAESAIVYAFEPYPPAAEVLRVNVALNALQSRVHPVEQAVAERSGCMDFYIPAKTHGDTLEMSASLDPEFRAQHSEVLSVAVTTIDEFVAERNVARVDLLRIDAENCEHLVLQGGQHVLETHRPLVLIEVLEEAKCSVIEDVRARHRYAAFLIEGAVLREYHPVAFQPTNDNQILCPEEKRSYLERVARSCGLSVC